VAASAQGIYLDIRLGLGLRRGIAFIVRHESFLSLAVSDGAVRRDEGVWFCSPAACADSMSGYKTRKRSGRQEKNGEWKCRL